MKSVSLPEPFRSKGAVSSLMESRITSWEAMLILAEVFTLTEGSEILLPSSNITRSVMSALRSGMSRTPSVMLLLHRISNRPLALIPGFITPISRAICRALRRSTAALAVMFCIAGVFPSGASSRCSILISDVMGDESSLRAMPLRSRGLFSSESFIRPFTET